MEDEDLRADNHAVDCGRCGKYYDWSVLSLDEEEGTFLCPMCQAESVSCGCSDEVQMET
jgi:transcription elongation factor Elf1